MIRRALIKSVLFAVACMVMAPVFAGATELWQTLPPTPAPVAAGRHATVNGIRLYYVETGSGSPVLLLHGGLSNSDYLADVARALAPKHRVILVDSRGHGRSTRDGRPFGYDLMADDVVALLDALKVDKAAVVGWSDGAIIGLDLAMRHPARVTRVFAFGANTLTSGVKEDVEQNPTFAAFVTRASGDYTRLSPTPGEYDAFHTQIGKMWESEPNWTDAQLATIKVPIWIVDGEHDEAIKREHTDYMASVIPGAKEIILPNASHFAALQAPDEYSKSVLDFIDAK